MFQGKRPLPITEKKIQMQETGTIITVKNFMFSMPVRRKRINEIFDLEEMKTQLKYLAVIHYHVSIIIIVVVARFFKLSYDFN